MLVLDELKSVEGTEDNCQSAGARESLTEKKVVCINVKILQTI